MASLIIVGVIAILVALRSFKRVPKGYCGIVERLGRPQKGSFSPGWHPVVPVIDRFVLIYADPFKASLPSQSMITKDEVPFQVEASFEAQLVDAEKAYQLGPHDWRNMLVAYTQGMMKDTADEFDSKSLNQSFSAWVSIVETQLKEMAADWGVSVTRVNITKVSLAK